MISALILAAGMSKRAGLTNKLLVDIDGQPMITQVTRRTLASGVSPVRVITGFEHEKIMVAIAGLNVDCAYNPDYKEGMAASIRRGIVALDPTITGVIVCLGDMPWVETETLLTLIKNFSLAGKGEICRPSYHGQSGNPVLFGRPHFPALMKLSGDRGGQSVINANLNVLRELNLNDAGVLRDVDRVPV